MALFFAVLLCVAAVFLGFRQGRRGGSGAPRFAATLLLLLAGLICLLRQDGDGGMAAFVAAEREAMLAQPEGLGAALRARLEGRTGRVIVIDVGEDEAGGREAAFLRGFRDGGRVEFVRLTMADGALSPEALLARVGDSGAVAVVSLVGLPDRRLWEASGLVDALAEARAGEAPLLAVAAAQQEDVEALVSRGLVDLATLARPEPLAEGAIFERRWRLLSSAR